MSTRQGTGLRLSISYDIIKAHNDELKVETFVIEVNPGLMVNNQGSTFIILLPLH